MAAKRTKKEKWTERVKSLAEIITAVGIIGAAMVGVGTWCIGQVNATTNEKLDSISTKIDSIELNSTRNQLLTLMSDYPNNESEILKVADYYFNDLDGDWYMTELFSKWGNARGIDVSNIIKMKKEN